MTRETFWRHPPLPKRNHFPTQFNWFIHALKAYFSHLQKNELILKYRYRYSEEPQRHTYIVELTETFYFTLSIWVVDNGMSEKPFTIFQKKSRIFKINIFKSFDEKGNDLLLKIIINHTNGLMKGVKNETRVREIVQKMHPAENGDIFFLEKTSREGDQRGADIQLYFKSASEEKSIMVPLQIKSSAKHQEIHKESFPHIPSIIIKRRLSDHAIARNIIQIMQAYSVHNEVLHL